MKRLLALAVGAFGLRALLRRRRRASAPADELRDKLAAQRSTVAEPPPVAAEEPVSEPLARPQPEPEPERAGDDVETRRADVHARARQKIDELSG